MNKIVLTLIIALVLPGFIFSQKKKDKKAEGYKFTPVYEIKTTSVKDQNQTGTCWSFATTSFIETEAIRLGKEEIDISEMYFVKYAYQQKAKKYVLYHGTTNFSGGGQAHDVTNVIMEHGIVPEEVYDGIEYGEKKHIHWEFDAMLSAIVKVALKTKNGKLTSNWEELVNKTTDIYLGESPEKFTYKEKEYTPKTFQADVVGINPDDYIEFTSYSHYPYYEKVDLEIPDNWSHDDYYNLPVDEFMQVMDNALEKGFSVCWDGDMSEKTFNHKKGVAIIPEKCVKEMEEDEISALWEAPGTEKVVTQELRQITFADFSSKDDHLMHLTGVATDQNGTKYYKTKNSWDTESNDFGGYLHMSESYVRLKTVAYMVHKDAVPEEIKVRLGIK